MLEEGLAMREDQWQERVVASVKQGGGTCCSQAFLKAVSFSLFTNDLEGEVNLISIRLTNVKIW